MHGLANTIANSSDKANIKRAFQSLYNDSEFQDKVIYQLWLAVYSLHYEKLKVLGVGEKDRLPKNKSKAEALLRNYVLAKKTEQQLLLIEILRNDQNC